MTGSDKHERTTWFTNMMHCDDAQLHHAVAADVVLFNPRPTVSIGGLAGAVLPIGMVDRLATY